MKPIVSIEQISANLGWNVSWVVVKYHDRNPANCLVGELIEWWLRSSGIYFMDIQDESKLMMSEDEWICFELDPNTAIRATFSWHIILCMGRQVFTLTLWCCLLIGKAPNTKFNAFGSTRPRIEFTTFRTSCEQANHYTTEAFFSTWRIIMFIHVYTATYKHSQLLCY